MAVSRRRFLDWLLGLGGLAWLAGIIYPTVRYLSPLPGSGPGGPTTLTAEEVQKVEKERFCILRAGDRRVMVFRDADDELRALDAKCTHEGCTVTYVPAESVIACACHNARFDIDGRVISGPPPRPLPQHDVHQDDAGNVIVQVRRA